MEEFEHRTKTVVKSYNTLNREVIHGLILILKTGDWNAVYKYNIITVIIYSARILSGGWKHQIKSCGRNGYIHNLKISPLGSLNEKGKGIPLQWSNLVSTTIRKYSNLASLLMGLTGIMCLLKEVMENRNHPRSLVLLSKTFDLYVSFWI